MVNNQWVTSWYSFNSKTGFWVPYTPPPIITVPPVAPPPQTTQEPTAPPDDLVYVPESNILVGLRGNQLDAHELAKAQLNALRTMRTSAHNLLTEAAKIIQQIDASGGLVTIKPGRGVAPYTSPEGKYHGAGTYSVLEYDPFGPEALVDLAHELVHARDFALGFFQSGDRYHFEAYRVQNQIAYELGLPTQTQWGNIEDPVIIDDPNKYIDWPTSPKKPKRDLPEVRLPDRPLNFNEN